MAGLGAGAGAAARIEFEEKLAEEARQADMRAAQNAAQQQEQARQFDARQAAAAEERDYQRGRQERMDAAADEERAYRRGREARLDELAMEDRDYQRERQSRMDARQSRLDERQDRLDAMAMEDRDYQRNRQAALDAQAAALNDARLQRFWAEQDEYNADLAARQKKRDEEALYRESRDAHAVISMISAPSAKENPLGYKDVMDKANEMLGTDYDFFRVDDRGGLMLYKAARDKGGNVLMGQNGGPQFEKFDYVNPAEMAKFAGFGGMQFDTNQRRWVMAGSTAYTGKKGGALSVSDALKVRDSIATELARLTSEDLNAGRQVGTYAKDAEDPEIAALRARLRQYDAYIDAALPTPQGKDGTSGHGQTATTPMDALPPDARKGAGTATSVNATSGLDKYRLNNNINANQPTRKQSGDEKTDEDEKLRKRVKKADYQRRATKYNGRGNDEADNGGEQ